MPGSFGWLAGAEASMAWGSPGAHYAWSTLIEWLELEQALARGGLGCTETGDHLGGVVEAGAGMDGGLPWGELVWTKGLGLTGVTKADQLEHLDSAPICTIKVEGNVNNCAYWYLQPGREFQ